MKVIISRFRHPLFHNHIRHTQYSIFCCKEERSDKVKCSILYISDSDLMINFSFFFLFFNNIKMSQLCDNYRQKYGNTFSRVIKLTYKGKGLEMDRTFITS